MKRTLALLVKVAVTVGIFVGIFLEFGGGYARVETATLSQPGAFETTNPDYPGIVGRLKAKLRHVELPAPRVPVSIDQVCVVASERSVFVHTADGAMRRFKPIRHCGQGGFTMLYRRAADDSYEPVPRAEAPPEAYVRLQGFQLVPAEPSELLN